MTFIHKVDMIFTSATENDIAISSTGKFNELHINISSTKNNLGQPNSTIIKIDNLARATREALISRDNKWTATILVGYLDTLTPLETLTVGRITLGLSSAPNKGNITTTLYVREGDFDYNSTVGNLTFEADTPLSDVVVTTASEFEDIEVNAANIDVGTATLGSKGLTIAGRIADNLNALASRYGFGWSIQEESFAAFNDFSSSNRQTIITADANNLMNATPLFENVLQFPLGVEITTLLEPSVRPYDQVVLTSQVNPQLDNTHTVTTLTHIIDTHGQPWQTTMQCLINGTPYLEQFK